MELTKREKTIKYLVYALIVGLSALIQNVGGLSLEIGRARCFILIPVALLLSIGEQEIPAAIIGLSAGLLWDMVSAQHTGYNSIFLMVMCYFMAVMISHLLRGTYWVGVVCSILSTLFYVVIYWLLFVVAKGGDGAIMTFVYFYLPSFIYTSVATVLLNLFIVPLKGRLNKE